MKACPQGQVSSEQIIYKKACPGTVKSHSFPCLHKKFAGKKVLANISVHNESADHIRSKRNAAAIPLRI